MTVREFIQQITDGTLHYRNDIVNSIPVSWDKTDLVNDMFYYDRVEDPKTGTIPVLNVVEKQRLYDAIKFIYNLYQPEISYFPIWELDGEDLSDMPNSVEASTIQIESGALCEFDNSPSESIGYEEKQIPKELQTEGAKILLSKLIENGFCDDRYNWNKDLQLLSYFAKRASLHLKLSNKTKVNRYKRETEMQTSWKPFRELFTHNSRSIGKTQLHDAEQNWIRINITFHPTGYEDIDKLFE